MAIEIESGQSSRQQQDIDKPRNERLRDQTSGEKAWLKTLSEEMEMDDVDEESKNKNNHHLAETDMDIDMDGTDSTKPYNTAEEELIFSKTNSVVVPEADLMAQFLPLSQPHGLDATSSVDRATMAQLLNLVHSEHENSESASASTSSLNTAYYFIGLFYFYGLADMSGADTVKAMQWFHSAAENGHGDAQCALGLILYYGIRGVIGKDQKSAMRWFYRASVDLDYPRGHWLLGKVIYEGMFYDDIMLINDDEPNKEGQTKGDGDNSKITDDRTRNFAESARLFQKAADHDIPEALHQLALMYEYGLISTRDENGTNSNQGRESNYSLAQQNYKKAAELGYVQSFYHLGLMYAYGRGVASNFAIAADYFRRGAMHNHAPSLRYLGIFAINGYDQLDGIPNAKLALHWYEKCIQLSLHSHVKDLCATELAEIKLVVDSIKAHELMALKNITKSGDDNNNSDESAYMLS